jgi:hypothetical protein
MRTPAPLILLPLLAGCMTPEEGSGPGGACPISGSSDWAAWVNAMPGPERPSLIVTGRVTVPTGGYQLALERGPLREIDPPVQEVTLSVRPPSGPATQAVVTHEVRGQWPALDRSGAVVVRCGGETLAEIRPVERAY